MTRPWGRSDRAGSWLHPKPICSLAVALLAPLGGAVIAGVSYAAQWTPMERLYLGTYVRSALLDGVGFTATGHYRLLEVVGATRTRLALNEEVRPATPDADESSLALTDTDELPFALTDAALRVGDRRLVWTVTTAAHAPLHRLLQHWIYSDQSLFDLMRPALAGTLGLSVIGLLVAVPRDLTRARERRLGRRLKGPELVSPEEFTSRQAATGIGFTQRGPSFRPAPVIRLPRVLESSHLLVIGDSGTGKSMLIRQLLDQLVARGDAAIIYDPALEYTAQFYDPARGDVILNPLDERSPYWSPGEEWRHEAETLTLATSLFPDRSHGDAFFTDAPRRIFAHLLTLKPTPQQLTDWLCHPEAIDERLQGTPYAAMIDRQAPAQRSGVLASLNMVADALRLLPLETEAKGRWSARAWATNPTGWLFLTSTAETRPRLVPLTSLWLDTLVLRLMHPGRRRATRVWFILDELASLQRLPQLHTALTENRKSNNPVVLGFQGRSQLESRYGHDAEAMLSQPATKIFLRTSEPHAAQWIADAIGDVEIERLRESRSQGPGGQISYSLERQVEPLVMASEIMGLPNLHGYLKQGNLVVPVRVPYRPWDERRGPFSERPEEEPPSPILQRPAPSPPPVTALIGAAGPTPPSPREQTAARQHLREPERPPPDHALVPTKE